MPNGTKVMIGFLVGLALATAAYFGFDAFVVQACADGGGNWDWSTFTCEGGAGIPNPAQ